jgi:DNA-directed RNA polymerase specialized sigma24 family protein
VDREAFERFVADVEPRLRRALVALRGPEQGRDAVAEALAWAWEHWDRARALDNPAGYLYRVGQSRTRWRRSPAWGPTAEPDRLPDVEPRLPAALAALSDRQRVSVFLVQGCGWSHVEVAGLLGISASSVANHVARGMARLRAELKVPVDA